MTKTRNILIRVPIKDMDDIGPKVGSMHRLRERGGEGREIEAQVTAQGARWSNATTGQNGRWIRVEVPADWAGTADVEEDKTADDLLAEAAGAEKKAIEALVGATRDVVSEVEIERIRGYPVEVSIEWNLGGGPHQYVIQLGPAVRVSGQLQPAESWFDTGGVPETARLAYRNESVRWKEPSLSANEQRAVNQFAREILKTPHTAQQAAEAQVAAIREIMSEPDRKAVQKYPAEVSFEWDFGGSPSYYVVQLSPIVRISGQLVPRNDGSTADVVVLSQEPAGLGGFTLETARMEYQNQSTPWLELRLDGGDQHVVIEFIRELLKQE